jgi:U3 small nucleolar RNA-associated protein 7
MDSLFAKADALKPQAKRQKTLRKSSQDTLKRPSTENHTAQSVSKHTSVPRSLLPTSNELPNEDVPKFSHIANKKLRGELQRQSTHNARARALVKDTAEMLMVEDAGKIQLEGDSERTWRIGQEEIAQSAGQEAAKGRRELKLDGGPYRTRYTRNGRCVSQMFFI